MKSRTSFFNVSLLRKDMVRFAPAWALYGAFLLLVFSGNILSYDRAGVADALGDSLAAFGVFNLFYAMLCTQLLFGDLFQSRMCNALHALPIRREGWFVTHVLAGLAFCAIPVAAAGLVFLTVLGSYWMAGLLWMAGLILQFLFFFAVAVLSTMLVGNRFAAVVVYCILNFLSAIALWLFYSLYQPHLYGFVLDENPLLRLCPVVWMTQFDWFCSLSKVGLVQVQEGWGYLAICTVVGLVLLGLSVLLYRKRPLEKAGDFIVFKPTAPVFLVLYTFSAGAALHLFSNLFIGESTEFVFLVVGLAIGFFTGLMLLQRTLRVFRGKAFAGFAVLVAVFGLSLVLTILDPIGITRWVPEEKDIKWATVDYYSSSDMQDHAITDKEVLRQIISIHQHAVDNAYEANNGKEDVQVHLTYRLKNGQQVQRKYLVDTGTLAAMTLEHVLSRPEILFGSDFTTADALFEQLQSVEVERNDKVTYDPDKGYYRENITVSDPDQLRSLCDALMQDAMAGNLCQHWALRDGDEGLAFLYLRGKEYTTSSGIRTRHHWNIDCNNESTFLNAWIAENVK